MPLTNFGVVRAKALYRCGQPDADGFQALAWLDVGAVLKLNADVEYPVARERHEFGGMVIPGPSLNVFRPNPVLVRQCAGLIDEHLQAGLVLAVHCTHGRDRTGLAIGAWRLIYEGWTLEHVLDELATYGVAGIVKLADHAIVGALEAIARARRV